MCFQRPRQLTDPDNESLFWRRTCLPVWAHPTDCKRTRTRTVEDILKDLKTEVTEHTLHRDYCPSCKKHVEPTVPDALPNATIGNNLVAMTGWLHYGIGVTVEQVRELVGIHLHTALSDGGLISAWRRLGELLAPTRRDAGTCGVLDSTIRRGALHG